MNKQRKGKNATRYNCLGIKSFVGTDKRWQQIKHYVIRRLLREFRLLRECLC